MSSELIFDQQSRPFVIGVDLGGTQLRVAVLHGVKLCSRVSFLTGENPSPDCVIPCIRSGIEQALAQADVRLEQIAGIGMGIAGLLNSQMGIVFASPNLPGWYHVPLSEIFNSYYNMPVFIENDANVAALGEYLFGASRGYKNVVYLSVSTGIGSGVIIDGKIMEGASNTAGEVGHMIIDWEGERCNCGGIGCLESIASGTAIARRANEAVMRGVNFSPISDKHSEGRTSDAEQQFPIDAKVVASAAKAGVPEACAIIADAARGLGVGLVNIIHIFNPEMIVLGGGVIQMGPMLLEPALQLVRERTLSVPYNAVRIVQAQLGVDTGLIGAGAFVYSSLQSLHEKSYWTA